MHQNPVHRIPRSGRTAEHITASTDAFAVLEDVVGRRLTRKLCLRCCGAPGPSRSRARFCGCRRPCATRVRSRSGFPLIVGGGGELRTLRLAARYADAVNVFGGVDTVRRKAAVPAAHCAEAGRDPVEVALTHLSTTLVGRTDAKGAAAVERLRPRREPAARYAASVHAGTVADQVGRFRGLAEAGVREVMLRLPDLGADTGTLATFGEVIGAFR